jgi:hypothetical protein
LQQATRAFEELANPVMDAAQVRTWCRPPAKQDLEDDRMGLSAKHLSILIWDFFYSSRDMYLTGTDGATGT